MKLAFLKNIKN